MFDYNKALQLGLTPQEIAIGLAEQYGLDYDKATELGLTDDEIISELMARNGLSKEAPEEVERPEVEQPEVEQPEEKNFLLNFNMAPSAYQESWDAPGQAQTTFEVEKGPDGNLERGVKTTAMGLGVGEDIVGDDMDAAAKGLSQMVEYQEKNKGSQREQEFGAAWDSKEGFDRFGAIHDKVKERWEQAPDLKSKVAGAYEDAKEFGGLVARQLPNSALPVALGTAGAALGFVAPVPGATMGGMFAGYAAGNTAVEMSGIAMEMLNEAGIDIKDQAAVSKFLYDNRARIIDASSIKGTVIAGVDTITTLAGGKILAAPARQVTERVLSQMGVKLTDKAAVKAATESAEFMARAQADPVFKAATSGVRNIGRNATVAAMEPVSETAGEYLGGGAALGKWDVDSLAQATAEGVTAIGQSAAGFAGAKVYQAATSPITPTKMAAGRAQLFNRLEAELYAGTLTEDEVRQWHTDGVLDGYQVTTEDLDRVIKGANQKTVDEVLAKQAEMDQRRADILRGVQEEVEAGNESPESIIQRLENGEFAPDGISDDDIYNIIGEEYRPVDLTPEGKAKLEEEAKRTEQEEEFDEAFDEYEPELPTGAMPLQEDLARNRREVEDAAFASYYPDMPTSREEYEAQRAFIMRNPEDVYSTYSPELAQAIVVGKLPPPPWMHSKSTPIAQAEADDMYVEWLDQRLKALQYNRERNNTPDAQPAKPLTAAERKTLAQNAEWDELVRRYQEQGTGWIHTEPAEDKSQPFTMRPSEEVYSSYSPEVAEQAGRRQLPAPERKTNRIAEEAANQPKGLPAPVDKEKFEITGRPVEEIDAEVKAILKTPKKDRTPEQVAALNRLTRERRYARAREEGARVAAAARPAENTEGRTTVDQITAEITDLQARASIAEDTANQLEATGQVNKAAIERSKAATYRSRVSTLMDQRKALKNNNTPDASVSSAPTGVTPTTARVPSVAPTSPAAGGATAVESVPEAPTTPKRGKKAAKKVQEADPPSVETVTAPVAETEASTPEVSAEMSPEMSTETPEIAAEVAPASPEMSPEMSTSEKQEKRTPGQRMVAFSMATTPEEYDAVVSDMTAEEVDAFEDSLGWADGETTFKEIRDALNRRRRTIGAARKQEPGAQRLTAFKAELAKVVSKGRANGIIALLKARAASAGTSVEQYLESRQLELVANSQAGTAAQRQANKGAFDVGTWVQEQRAIIHAFESADVSTIAHELAHLFRRDLAMAKDNTMLQLAEEWAGVKDGVWTEAQEEKFARAFERYLAEGKAPNAGLKKLFDAFKKWIIEVYRAIKGSDIDVKLTPQIRVVFDALLTEGYVQDKGAQDATQDGDGMLNQTMSTRMPTSKKATEDPLNEALVLDHEITMADEVTLAKNMAVVAQYPNMRKLTGRGAKSPKRQAEAFIDHIVDNLLFLHDLVPSEFRRRAKLWYDGGRKIVETWADRYGISEMQASATIAVLSPQNDWFANVTHAERVMDIVFSMRDFRWDDAMTKTAKQIEAAMSETAKETEAKVGHFRNAKGKTLGELLDNPAVAARWIRVFDQTHNSRYHAVLTPEGGVAGNKKRSDGQDAIARWKSFSAIAKAVSVLTDGRAENIFYQLGGEHKVRNFYNNLFDPQSGLPFVTIDTHAVAAGLLRPLAGESLEVKHNFGTGKGSSSSTITGQSGTYPLFAEAYRRAAEARGVSPREMQSIAWEIARGLFNNKSKNLNEAADEIWTSYKKGELTQQEAQAKILELVGGVKDPDWIDVPFNDTFGPTYEGKSRQAFVDRKNAGAAPNDHRIFFEVAPDPDNKELSARWKAISEEEQQRVSKDIMDLVLPRIMAEFGVSGTVEFQLGGYEGEPNPSFALSLSRPEDSVAVAKMLGHVLSQKGMMVVAGEHLMGTSPVGAVIVELPDGYGATEVNTLYDRLWTLEKDGERLVGGHSTNGGQMVILNFTGVDTDQLAMLIYDHLGGEFEVGTDTVFSTYFEKEEYGYADQSEHKDKTKPSVQTRGDLLRDEASRRLEAALAEREQSAGLLFQSGPGDQRLAGEGDLRGGRAPNGVPVREDGRVGLVHFSRQAGLQELDPAKHGTGLSGAESRRKQNDPQNWVDRTYFAIEGGGYRKEVGLGPHRYNASLNPEQLYNAVEDPDGFMAKAREIRQADPFVDTTSVFERLIKDAGYQGYFSNRMGLVAAVYTKTKPESYQNQPEQGLLFQEKNPEFKPVDVNSPEFKRWFGDWQDPNAFSSRRAGAPVSVVVNEDGTPQRVFHTTRTPGFSVFEVGRDTTNSTTFGPEDTRRWAVFTTPDSTFSAEYGGEEGAATLPLYISIKSPLDLTKGITETIERDLEREGVNIRWMNNVQNSWELFDGEDGKLFVEAVQRAGYDGAIIEEESSDGRMVEVFATFSPTQIKSALSNTGEFSDTNPNMLFQERPTADLREDLFEGESREALVEIGTRVYNRGLHKVGEFTKGMEEELGALYEQYKGAKINKLFTEVRKKVAAEKKSARIDSLLEAAQKEMPLRNKRRFRELIQAVADTRLDIHQKEKIFIKYAKEKLPEQFRGGEVLQFITQISGKGTPAGRQKVLLEGLKLIDRTYDKVEAEQAVKKIMRLVRSVKPKVVDKKLKGDGFTPDTFEVMAAIRKVVTMGRDAVTQKMEAILNLADAEGRDLSTDLNPNGATSLEKLSELQQYIILQRFGALRHKSGAEALKTLDWLEGFLKAKKDEYLANEKHFRYKVKTMTNLFVAEATGGKGVKSWAGQQQDASDRQKSIWKKLKDMASNFDTGHLSFEMILDKLTQEAGGLLNARSVRYFSNMLHNATRRYDAGVIKYQGVLADKVQEIYGMKGSKLERILNDNGIIRTQTGVIVKPAKKGQDGKYLKDEDGNFIFEEEGEQLPLSQNQAYKLWQALQDPEVLNSQRVHGLNEETIVQLENFIDKKVMDWAKWQLQEFYPSYYKTINVTYKQLFHVDLPLNSYYSPISREHDGADKNELSLVGRSHLSSVINNSLLSRSKSNSRLILSDGDSVIQQHVIMMEHFKAWALPMREIRGVFHSKEVMEAIKQTGTKFTLDVLHKMIDDLARGGVDRATALGAMDRARNRVTTSMIGLSPKIVAIQMTAIPAYMMEIPMGAFLKGFGKGMAMLATNPRKFVSVIKASKMMQNRYKVGWERDLILLNRRRSAAILSGKSSLSDLFMATVKLGDMAAVFTGGFAVYEYQYDQAIKMGMTPEAAHDYALDRFEIATERTQQAGNVKDLAHFQTAGGSFGKLFTMFMTQPNAIYRGTMVGWRAAIADLKKGRMPRPAAIRRIAVGHFVLPVIFQLVSNGFDWDTEDQLATLALGPFAGMIFVRDIVEGIAAVTQYGYAAMRPQMSPIFSGFESLLRAIYHSIVKEDPTTEDYITTMHAMGSLAGNLTGAPVDPVVRSAKGVYRALEGETDHPLLEMLGWGPGSFPEDDGW